MKAITLIAAAMLAMSCSPAKAQDGGSPMHHQQIETGKLYVSATGMAAQAPDQASVSAGVITQAPTAGDAMRANADQMNAVYRALKAAGIKPNNIMTSQMSLQPQYDYQNRKAPRITGYEVRNTVTAKSEDLTKVGPMLDALVKAGVNNINGVNFSIKDSKSAKAKARTDAIKQAKAKAKSMADAAGVTLGKVLEIRESGGGYTPQPRMMAARAMEVDMAPTPVSGGEQTLSVTVNIVYALD